MSKYNNTIIKGSYAVEIKEQSDGEFRATFLYNVKNPTRDFTNGDIHDMKVYKTIKTCERRAEAYFAKQLAA